LTEFELGSKGNNSLAAASTTGWESTLDPITKRPQLVSQFSHLSSISADTTTGGQNILTHFIMQDSFLQRLSPFNGLILYILRSIHLYHPWFGVST
jgi:hypothetical protein